LIGNLSPYLTHSADWDDLFTDKELNNRRIESLCIVGNLDLADQLRHSVSVPTYLSFLSFLIVILKLTSLYTIYLRPSLVFLWNQNQMSTSKTTLRTNQLRLWPVISIRPRSATCTRPVTGFSDPRSFWNVSKRDTYVYIKYLPRFILKFIIF